VRRFWKGDEGQLSDFAYRITGSSDLYQYDGRKPYASINFVTAHDGFTLNDLVSYNDRHNEANGENNNDGDQNNHSWNMGAEGPTDDPEIIALRKKQVRNFMTTLLFSQGVPLISGGDEIERTQHGNNNAYCQDDEITWQNWDLDDEKKKMLDFTSKLIKLRREHPNLHRRKFFQDRTVKNSVVRDIAWYNTDGNEMPEQAWESPWVRSIGFLLNGKTLQVSDEDGNPVVDDSFLVLMNASYEGVEFKLPPPPNGNPWRQLLDTEDLDDPFADTKVHATSIVGGRSINVFTDAPQS
jgi:glycogen operon protein